MCRGMKYEICFFQNEPVILDVHDGIDYLNKQFQELGFTRTFSKDIFHNFIERPFMINKQLRNMKEKELIKIRKIRFGKTLNE